jgi:hypothetical protein
MSSGCRAPRLTASFVPARFADRAGDLPARAERRLHGSGDGPDHWQGGGVPGHRWRGAARRPLQAHPPIPQWGGRDAACHEIFPIGPQYPLPTGGVHQRGARSREWSAWWRVSGSAQGCGSGRVSGQAHRRLGPAVPSGPRSLGGDRPGG